MRRNRWLLLVAALVAILALGAAGCGGRRRRGGGRAGETGATDTGGRAGSGAGDHDRLGSRAAVARPGSCDGHDVVERHPEPHGSARRGRTRTRSSLSQRSPRAGRSTGRHGGHVPPQRRTGRGRTAIRSPRRTSCTRGSGRFRPRWRPTTPTSCTASWARPSTTAATRRTAHASAGRRGRRHGSGRPHAPGELTSRQPWFIAQVRAPLVPPGSPSDGRAVRRQVDGAGEHRHQRPVHARVVGARGVDRPGQERRLARRRRGRRSSASNGRIIVDGTTRVQAFEAGEVDALDGAGLPPADIAAAEGASRLRAVSRPRARTTTGSTSRTSPTQPAEGDVAR